MPTSATGADRRAEQGFSLVEVMVALVVMGLLTGAVLLTVPEREGRLSDEADRLGARLTHAREEALTTSRPVEMVIRPDGYDFRTQRRGEWIALDEPPFGPGRWSEGVTASLETAGGSSAVRFDTTGAADPALVRLAGKSKIVQVIIDAQGEVRVDAGG